MDSPGLAFGKPLRHSSWRKLAVRQRLALELAEFTAIESDAPKSLSVFWHNAHVPALGMLARVDCPGSFNVCMNVDDLSVALPALNALLWCSGLVIVRDTDDASVRRSLCSVPIAVDFAGFEGDVEFRGKEPPPVVAGRGQFEFTSSLVETASGPAVVAMGMIPIHERLFDWMYGDAEGIDTTGRVFLGAFLPPTFVEAAFLECGLFYHRSTSLLPTFFGDPPWVPDGPVTAFTFRLPYLHGCEVSDMTAAAEGRYAELDGRARILRSLIDQAENFHAVGAGTARRAQWEADKDGWERAQTRLLEDVLEEMAASGGPPVAIEVGLLTVYVCTNVPRGGTWVKSIPQLEQDVQTFAGSAKGGEYRRGPFSFATIAL
ncbi:MAG: hypothetical protein ABI779_12630 [Acidobacteriota bacterium]